MRLWRCCFFFGGSVNACCAVVAPPAPRNRCPLLPPSSVSAANLDVELPADLRRPRAGVVVPRRREVHAGVAVRGQVSRGERRRARRQRFSCATCGAYVYGSMKVVVLCFVAQQGEQGLEKSVLANADLMQGSPHSLVLSVVLVLYPQPSAQLHTQATHKPRYNAPCLILCTAIQPSQIASRS